MKGREHGRRDAGSRHHYGIGIGHAGHGAVYGPVRRHGRALRGEGGERPPQAGRGARVGGNGSRPRHQSHHRRCGQGGAPGWGRGGLYAAAGYRRTYEDE